MNDEILASTASYPRFSDGRIDYTHQRRCYGVMCIVMCGERILLVRRSDKVMAHSGLYSGISGFIDDEKLGITDTALLELHEEVDAPAGHIVHIAAAEPVVTVEESLGREWVDYPVLVEFSHEFVPKINWEATDAGWYDIAAIASLPMTPDFLRVLRAVQPLRRPVTSSVMTAAQEHLSRPAAKAS